MANISEFDPKEGFSLYISSTRDLRQIARNLHERLVFDRKSNRYWINEEDEGAQLCFAPCEDGFRLVYINCFGYGSSNGLKVILRTFEMFRGSIEIFVNWENATSLEEIRINQGRIERKMLVMIPVVEIYEEIANDDSYGYLLQLEGLDFELRMLDPDFVPQGLLERNGY